MTGAANQVLKHELQENLERGTWQLAIVSVSSKCQQDINTHVSVTTNLVQQEDKIQGSSETMQSETVLTVVLLKGRKGYKNTIGRNWYRSTIVNGKSF